MVVSKDDIVITEREEFGRIFIRGFFKVQCEICLTKNQLLAEPDAKKNAAEMIKTQLIKKSEILERG
jgi:hypothetical protein